MMPAAPDKSSVPFTGALTDSFELMKKVWNLSGLPAMPHMPTMPSPASLSQFSQTLPPALPAMIAPTLDINELDKRIADLRAVEQWLALNVNVLRTTIQGLEVQRNTIAALKGFGGSLFAATQGTTQGAADAAKNAASPASSERPRAADISENPSDASAPLASAAAWWGALQEQFAKVTAAALSGQISAAPSAAPNPATSSPKVSSQSAAPKPRAQRKRS